MACPTLVEHRHCCCDVCSSSVPGVPARSSVSPFTDCGRIARCSGAYIYSVREYASAHTAPGCCAHIPWASSDVSTCSARLVFTANKFYGRDDDAVATVLTPLHRRQQPLVSNGMVHMVKYRTPTITTRCTRVRGKHGGAYTCGLNAWARVHQTRPCFWLCCSLAEITFVTQSTGVTNPPCRPCLLYIRLMFTFPLAPPLCSTLGDR